MKSVKVKQFSLLSCNIGSINFGVGGNQRLFLLSIKKET